MKTERELFKEWFIKEHGDNEPKFVEDYAWQIWQASANREGYKLVPVEPSEKMMDAGRIAKFETKGSLRQEYKAMIGASE